MLKKLSWGILLLPLALIIQVLIFGSGVMLLRAGTGSLKDTQTDPHLYAVLIDTDHYSIQVNGEAFKGLPDSHDFSKNKDFFAIFPALYCSGKKHGDDYEADYCSPWGKQLFDLHWLWRVWGVDLVESNLVGSRPVLIYAGLMTTTATTGASIVCWLFAWYVYWSIVLAAILSWVSAVAIIATAVVSHTFIDKLVSKAAKLHVGGSGEIVAKWGDAYIRIMWIGCGFALVTAIHWSFIVWREYKKRAKSARPKRIMARVKKVPFIAVVRRATGGLFGAKVAKDKTSYEHLAATGEDMIGLSSRDGSPVRLGSLSKAGSRNHSRANSRDRSTSRGPSPEREMLYERGQITLTDQDTAYEPMRHRDVG